MKHIPPRACIISGWGQPNIKILILFSPHLTLLCSSHTYLWETEFHWITPSFSCLFRAHGLMYLPCSSNRVRGIVYPQKHSAICTSMHTKTLSVFSAQVLNKFTGYNANKVSFVHQVLYRIQKRLSTWSTAIYCHVYVNVFRWFILFFSL